MHSNACARCMPWACALPWMTSAPAIHRSYIYNASPLDQLKIDRSFVTDLLTQGNDACVARSVVALGHALGCPSWPLGWKPRPNAMPWRHGMRHVPGLPVWPTPASRGIAGCLSTAPTLAVAFPRYSSGHGFRQPQAPLPQERLSLPAVAAATLLHVALLWFILQTTPVVQVTRQVVYQLLTPITRVADPTPSHRRAPPIQAPKPQLHACHAPRTVTPRPSSRRQRQPSPYRNHPPSNRLSWSAPEKELVRTVREKPLEVAPKSFHPRCNWTPCPRYCLRSR